MDDQHPKYNLTAIQCMEKKIENCENQSSTFWYVPGPLKLTIGGVDEDKCSISIARQDWGDYGVRTSSCDIPLLEMVNWKSWKNPDGYSYFADHEGKSYCYLTPVEMTPEILQDMLANVDKSQIKLKPPLKQMKRAIDPNTVVCNEGLQLIFKSTDGSPACVKPKTAGKLIARGWATEVTKPKQEMIKKSVISDSKIWYVGEGLKKGDYFSYIICHIDFNECTPFRMDFWIEDILIVDGEERWNARVQIYDENKTIHGTMQLGKYAAESAAQSFNIKNYALVFNDSVAWLSDYTVNPSILAYNVTKHLELERWDSLTHKNPVFFEQNRTYHDKGRRF